MNEDEDRDQVVLVSGASRGIGLAIAREFLSAGARVALLARDRARLRHAEELLAGDRYGGRILLLQADASREKDATTAVQSLLGRWGRVDTAVMNAGSGSGATGWRVGATDWDAALAANLASATHITEAVIPTMVAAGRGSLVFVASIAGVESIAAPLPYSAAKAAVVNYSANLARELGPHGIRVNAVAPGNVLFPGGSWATKLDEAPERWNAYVSESTPLRRFGTPEEIAGPVVFLASSRASFITGACLIVDGGQTRSI